MDKLFFQAYRAYFIFAYVAMMVLYGLGIPALILGALYAIRAFWTSSPFVFLAATAIAVPVLVLDFKFVGNLGGQVAYLVHGGEEEGKTS